MATKLKFWIISALTVFAIFVTWFIAPIPQNPAYHLFADRRYHFGIPNFYNVITNIPFVIIGIIGIVKVNKSGAEKPFNIIYSVLFLAFF